MENLLIDLTRPQDACKLAPEHLIHRTEFNQVLNWISDVEKSLLVGGEQYHHQTITVLGTRGSGKTTFLLSLRDYFEKQRRDEVLFFQIIDPTMIENKGHIFLNVVSAIHEQVITALSHKTNDNLDFTEIKRQWEEQLNKLAHGLPAIDGVGGPQMDNGWQDPEYIMEKGLQALESARNLRESFRDLVQLALDILGKKYFIIAFDDIDIDFQKGWPVLEMLRKYFASAKVVTLVSGNLQLYTLAVRKHYQANFGKSSMIPRTGIDQDQNLEARMLTEMEGQYLLKVLKPERRVQLATLFELNEKWKLQNAFAYRNNQLENLSDFPVYVDAGFAEPVSITDMYKRLCTKFGIYNSYQMEAYTSFLLGLPLRTQIQLLAEYTQNGQNTILATRPEEPFLTELFEKGIDTNLLYRSPQLINVEILKFLLREKGLGELYQLQPVTGDHSINSCLVALSFQFTQKAATDPYVIFDYFIKIGYVRNLQTIMGDRPNDSSSSSSIQGLCKYAGLFQNKVLRDIVGNMTSYLKGMQPSAEAWAGFISLPGLGVTAKQSEAEVAGRIDVVFRNETERNKVLGFLPLSLGAFTTRNRTVPLYSFYMLLGSIGEIIRKAQQRDLRRGLIELSQIRTYSIPEFERSTSIGANMFHSEADYEINDLRSLNILLTQIEGWVNEFPGAIPVAPHLLGKIATRTFYALNSIENASSPENLGEQMHSRVMAFFNAVLIEEARETVFDFQSFNINNTVLASTIFVRNLKAANQVGRNQMFFSKWILSCPLLHSYLKPERSVMIELSTFCGLQNEELRRRTVYSILEKVKVPVSQTSIQETITSINPSYVNLVELFRKNNIPFDLFVRKANPATRRQLNEQIRHVMGNLVGIGDWSSQKIGRFRNYLYENRIRW